MRESVATNDWEANWIARQKADTEKAKMAQDIADLRGMVQCLMTRLTTVETFLFDAGDRKSA